MRRFVIPAALVVAFLAIGCEQKETYTACRPVGSEVHCEEREHLSIEEAHNALDQLAVLYCIEDGGTRTECRAKHLNHD